LLVDSQVSLLIAGSRGSGKTSLLGAMMLELLPKSRIITIEDTLELPIEHLRELGYDPGPSGAVSGLRDRH